MSTKVELECNHCSKSFLRKSSDIKYNEKVSRTTGKLFFCSRECRQEHTRINGSHSRDEFTGLRELLRSSVRRLGKENTLTLEQMRDVWIRQGGICPYTGVEIFLATNFRRKNLHSYNTASLDRIDGTKHYTADNIQFTSIMANYAKNRASHEDMLEFIRLIRENKIQ